MKRARPNTTNCLASGPSPREVEEAIAAVMANTRRRARRLNALEIAQKIEFARHALGSLQIVAERTILSYEMIRQIHSALKCTDRVKKLVTSGHLSSFDILHRLSKLSSGDQDTIADAVVSGKVDSDDVRGLVGLRRETPSVPMRELIARIRASKNIRHYIAYFSVPPNWSDAVRLRRSFEKALGQNAIVSVNLKGCLGTLTMNAEGRKRLQEQARKKAMTKREIINRIIVKGTQRNG